MLCNNVCDNKIASFCKQDKDQHLIVHFPIYLSYSSAVVIHTRGQWHKESIPVIKYMAVSILFCPCIRSVSLMAGDTRTHSMSFIFIADTSCRWSMRSPAECVHLRSIYLTCNRCSVTPCIQGTTRMYSLSLYIYIYLHICGYCL